jgi:hypothetical protein
MIVLNALNGRERRLAGAALLLSALVACAGVLFTAPPGSTISLIANPPFVASDGGVSVITAIVIEPNGTPVSDGTVVLFFTDLGTIEAQGKTKNGLAKVNFISDSRSGTANIRALSGGPAPAGGGTTPSPNPSASTGPPTGGGGGSGDATVQVVVGNVRIQAIRLRADPPRITTSNSTHVFAFVIDANGNGIPNVPVRFEVLPDGGTASPVPGGNGTEFFDISGPVFTNNNGEAENVMRTRRETQGTAQVRAVAPGAGGFVESNTLGIPIR